MRKSALVLVECEDHAGATNEICFETRRRKADGLTVMGESNEATKLSEADIERIVKDVSKVVFRRLLRQLSVAIRVPETTPALEAARVTQSDVKPTVEAMEKVRARRARRGVY